MTFLNNYEFVDTTIIIASWTFVYSVLVHH